MIWIDGTVTRYLVSRIIQNSSRRAVKADAQGAGERTRAMNCRQLLSTCNNSSEQMESPLFLRPTGKGSEREVGYAGTRAHRLAKAYCNEPDVRTR